MTKTTTRVLAGVAVAALAAAGVAAAVRYRRGHQPARDERLYLDELEARLLDAEVTGQHTGPSRMRSLVESLQRNQDISVARLQRWIGGLKRGTLDPDEATLAESDFDALERQADQGGM